MGDRTNEVDRALQQRGNFLVEIALGGGNAPLHCGAEARIEMIEALPDDLLDPLEMPFPLLIGAPSKIPSRPNGSSWCVKGKRCEIALTAPSFSRQASILSSGVVPQFGSGKAPGTKSTTSA